MSSILTNPVLADKTQVALHCLAGVQVLKVCRFRQADQGRGFDKLVL